MPIYEYRRQDGTTFEVMQSITEDPLTEDPETGEPVQRVLHAPAVHFKGSGFYNTDYGTKKRQRETASSAEKGADANDAKAKEKSSSSSNGASSSSSTSSASSAAKD
ncbi:MAG TPA: FmdB family zinc ribbon protein [Capillimicrobium sp.]|nr:FmdB family zinc ribbon protein [Capillimicrobium sp.]